MSVAAPKYPTQGALYLLSTAPVKKMFVTRYTASSRRACIVSALYPDEYCTASSVANSTIKAHLKITTMRAPFSRSLLIDSCDNCIFFTVIDRLFNVKIGCVGRYSKYLYVNDGFLP